MEKLFITGIGTDVGKTFVSAILTEALQADYWKPVQAGLTPTTDAATVRGLVQNPVSRFWPERHRLAAAGLAPRRRRRREPHPALPPISRCHATQNHLVVEGAGGLLVPLAPGFLIADLVQQLGLAVVVVARHLSG